MLYLILGKPWCSAWGICPESNKEQCIQQQGEGDMNGSSFEGDLELDHFFLEADQ